MADDITQIRAGDGEAWERVTGDWDVRGVSVTRAGVRGAWQVTVAVAQYLRRDPLETELRERVQAALGAVNGVRTVDEEDREAWLVTGTAAGKDLAQAAASAVDQLADRAREYIDAL